MLGLSLPGVGCTWDEEALWEDSQPDHGHSDLDVVCIDEHIEGTDRESLNLFQSDANTSSEGKVSSRPMASLYLQPQVLETSDRWYRGEDCFDPGQITPEAAQQQHPFANGGLAWVGRNHFLHSLRITPVTEGVLSGGSCSIV